MGGLSEMGLDFEQLLQQIAEMLQDMDGSRVRRPLGARPGAAHRRPRPAREPDPPGGGGGRSGADRELPAGGLLQPPHREQMGLDGATDELESLADALEQAGMSPEELEALRKPDRGPGGGRPAQRARLHRARAAEAEPRLHGEVPARDPAREELLSPHRGGDPEDARGGGAPGPAHQEHPLHQEAAAQARASWTCTRPCAETCPTAGSPSS